MESFQGDHSVTTYGASVQINADKSEMTRRIRAFCDRKREDINKSTVRRYCGYDPLPDPGDDSDREIGVCTCARVDAIHIPRAGGTSRYKINSVYNKVGPQIASKSKVKKEPSANSKEPGLHAAKVELESRLQTLEQHCDLIGGDNLSLLQRIKVLEDRILYLEGLSLEYFSQSTTTTIQASQKPRPTRTNTHKANSATAQDVCPQVDTNTATSNVTEMPLDDIEERIQLLKGRLRSRHTQISQQSNITL